MAEASRAGNRATISKIHITTTAEASIRPEARRAATRTPAATNRGEPGAGVTTRLEEGTSSEVSITTEHMVPATRPQPEATSREATIEPAKAVTSKREASMAWAAAIIEVGTAIIITTAATATTTGSSVHQILGKQILSQSSWPAIGPS